MDRETVGEVRNEDKQQQARTKKRGLKMQLLAMTVCLMVLIAIMYGGMALYMKLNPESQAVMGNVSGLTLDEDGNVVESDGPASGTYGDQADTGNDVTQAVSDAIVYSQEELDERVAEAVMTAQVQGANAVLEAIREGFLDGNTLQTLRPLYPDDIVAYYNGQYYFIPIDRELAQSQFRKENLSFLENGEAQYIVDGQVVSHKGIDVSKFQGAIDWNLVAQDGVEFAFIRVGYRGYGTEGKLMEDDNFVANIEGAQAAGIKVGVYFYSQAVTEEEALEEANFVLERIAPYQLDCPVVYDVEKNSKSSARMNNISLEESTNNVIMFCQTIENAGYTPMIYHNLQWAVQKLDPALLDQYGKWFAAYETEDPYYPYEYKVWQYSATGSVQGINGNVDMNISFSPFWETQ